MMHTKVIVVDDAWSFIGSPNFDSRSLELNYEIALAVRDKELAEAIAASFEDDLGHAHEVELTMVEDWTVFERARNHLTLLLREQL
jgi:cardiolipin synthase